MINVSQIHHSYNFILGSSSRVSSSSPDLDGSICLFLATYSVIGLACALRNSLTFTTSLLALGTLLCPYCTIIIRLASGSGHSPHSASHRVFVGSWSECAFHAPYSCGGVGKKTHQFAMTSLSLACPASCPPFFLSWYHSLVCCILFLTLVVCSRGIC